VKVFNEGPNFFCFRKLLGEGEKEKIKKMLRRKYA
jgi:hypothetical protein